MHVMRFLILPYPLSLTRVFDTSGPKRDACRVDTHPIKPHPFSLCRGVGSSLRAILCLAPTTVSATRLPPPREKGGPWALRPRLATGLPFSRRRSARAHLSHATNSEASDTYARWTLLPRTDFVERRKAEVQPPKVLRHQSLHMSSRASFAGDHDARVCTVSSLGPSQFYSPGAVLGYGDLEDHGNVFCTLSG
jgi:hypothetical protein